MDAQQQHDIQQQVAAAVWTQLQQQQQIAAAAPAVAAAPQAPRPRLPAPAAFDGAASRLDEWRADLQQQFEYYGTHSDAERLRFAAGFIKGAARDWWVHLTDAARPATWDAFLVALRTRFQPVTTATTARAKIQMLTQGKMSVHDYTSAFRALLVAVPNMGEEDRLFNYQKGLNHQIALQLNVHNINTLEEAIAMASRVGSFGDAHAAGRAAPSASSSSSSAPMDLGNTEDREEDADAAAVPRAVAELRAEFREMLNAMSNIRGGRGGAGASSRGGFSSNLPRIPHLRPMQVKEYMDAGKCCVCGSTEHRSRDCPKRDTVFEQSGKGQARRGGFNKK